MVVTIKQGGKVLKVLGAPSNKPKEPAKQDLRVTHEDHPPQPDTVKGLVPIIDKMSITLTIPERDYEDVHKAVYAAIEEKALFQSAKKAKGYKVAHMIAIKGSAERVLFQFDPKGGKPPHARFEFNPSKLGPAGMEEFRAVLITLFNDGWEYVLKHGRISRLDVAIDLVDARMHHFLLLPAKGLAVREYKTDGKLKTLYVGKPKGNQTVLYSKSFHHKETGKPTIPPTVRLERRLRNPPAVSLENLGTLPNVFAGWKLVEVNLPKPEGHHAWIWPLFLDSIAIRGEVPALALLEEKVRTKFRDHLKQHTHPWWNPDAVWAHWPSVVSTLNLGA